MVTSHLDCKTGVEFVLGEFKLSTTDSIHVLSMYRPPNVHRSCITTALKFIAEFTRDAQRILFCGDLNVDVTLSRHAEFLDAQLALLGLTRLQYGPTHITGHSATEIDIVATSCTLMVTSSCISNTLFGSGHRMLSASLKTNLRTGTAEARSRTSRNWTNYQPELFNTLLATADWNSFSDLESSAETLLQCFTSNIHWALDSIAPFRSSLSSTRNFKHFKPEELRVLEAETDKLYSRYLRTLSHPDWQAANLARERALVAYTAFKDAQIAKILNDCRSAKDYWRELARWGLVDLPVGPGEDFDTEAYADFLLDLPHLDPNFVPPERPMALTESSFSFNAITISTVNRAIKDIASPAKGLDGVSIGCLRDFRSAGGYLVALFNTSLRSGSVPADLKIVRVTPIPKVPRPLSNKDLRPIAVGSSIAKILEKIVFTQLQAFVSSEGLLASQQYGFRPRRSSEMAVLHLVELIREAFSSKEVAVVLFLDFKRAFECVPHSVILAVLAECGLDHASVAWFEDFLKDRAFVVSGPTGQSLPRPSGDRGVPQGSSLAALLFVLVINRLLLLLLTLAGCIAYADDFAIVLRGPIGHLDTILDRLRACLSVLQRWLASHGFALNASKCQLMIFSSLAEQRQQLASSTLECSGVTLTPQRTVRYLGVMLQDDLRWDAHVSATSVKVHSVIRRLNWRKGCLSRNRRKQLMLALALPHVRFCAAVFTDMHTDLQRRMQHLINTCVRFVSPLLRFCPVSATRQSLGIKSYVSIRHAAVVSLLHRFLHDPDASTYFTERLGRMTPASARLRTISVLNPPANANSSRTSKLSFFTQAARAWNKLPRGLRAMTARKSFIKRLKSSVVLNKTSMNRSLFF